MAGNQNCLLLLAVMLTLLAVSSSAAAAATFISGDVLLESRGSVGRSLLQAKKNCPLNIEFMNYTIITSKCKGPNYPANRCCAAFKEFACPYAEQINDVSNDCAPIMFSYINLHEKYPPGLFASECKEGKEGLACPPLPDTSSSSSTEINESLQYLIIHISGFVAACILSFRF